VLAAIAFDDDSGFQTNKVANVTSYRTLAAEFEAIQSASPQKPPEMPFGLGRIAA